MSLVLGRWCPQGRPVWEPVTADTGAPGRFHRGRVGCGREGCRCGAKVHGCLLGKWSAMPPINRPAVVIRSRTGRSYNGHDWLPAPRENCLFLFPGTLSFGGRCSPLRVARRDGVVGGCRSFGVVVDVPDPGRGRPWTVPVKRAGTSRLGSRACAIRLPPGGRGGSVSPAGKGDRLARPAGAVSGQRRRENTRRAPADVTACRATGSGGAAVGAPAAAVVWPGGVGISGAAG